jgi:hypothetical protein
MVLVLVLRHSVSAPELLVLLLLLLLPGLLW